MSAQPYPKLAALSASLPDPIGPQDCTDENRQAVECYRELMGRDGGGAQLLADELERKRKTMTMRDGRTYLSLAPEEFDEILQALRAQGEPVAWMDTGDGGLWTLKDHEIHGAGDAPLYRLPAPPNERAK